MPVTEAMITASTASTTSRKIAATTLKPEWRRSRRIADMHLLEKADDFGGALDTQLQANNARTRADGIVGEGAAKDIARQQGIATRARRRGLRSLDRIAPVAAQLARAIGVALVGDRGLDDLEAVARRWKTELDGRADSEHAARSAEVVRAVVAGEVIGVRVGAAVAEVVDHDRLAAGEGGHLADHV